MKKVISRMTVALFAVLAFAAVFFISAQEDAPVRTYPAAKLVSSENEGKIPIAKNGQTDFTLIYAASDLFSEDGEYANEFSQLLKDDCGLSHMSLRADTITAEGSFEILFGNTNRELSQSLNAAMLEGIKNADDVAYAYAYKDGKLAFTANCTNGFYFGFLQFSEYLKKNNYAIDSDLYVVCIMTREEYLERYESFRVQAALLANSKFTQDDFGGAPLEMPTDAYQDPILYPAKDQHPRMFVAGADLEMIYNVMMTDPNMEAARKKIFELANSENFTGIFPEVVGKSGKVYRYDKDIIAQLEARAFLYLLTGEKSYGYEAIVGAKNAILSLHYTTDIHMDVYHGASHVMVNVAKVYDWCYDLLTEEDKQQIIAGVSNILAPQMESGMRFPPSGMTAIVGHGNGPQFIRDWMTVAIVFYDEMPSWWDFVGGRFYQEYVPVINAVSENSLAADGTTTYGDSKLFTRSWAAWLVTTTTGEFPYVEDFKKCPYYFFCHIQPNGKYFQTGDGARNSAGATIGDSCSYMMLTAMMYQDETIAAMAKYYTDNYTRFSYAVTIELTAADMVIFYALGPKTEEEHAEGIDSIQYFEAPAATMTARTSWDDDAAAVMMRIGTVALTGHNLYDHGTFQIYYKGLLAGTSGVYKEFGNYVHQHYLQMTVAHNGLLVFDPAFADDEPIYGKNADGTDNVFEITNAKRYFYSGSQRRRSTIRSVEDLETGEYTVATMLGADYGYNPDGSPKYAYIAADLASAYESSTVNFVGRKMLTVFTGNDEVPLYFFIYDQIDSTKDNQTKSFLLHTVKEPTVSEDGKTAIVEEGEGRLVMKKLSEDGTLFKVGGRVDTPLGEGEKDHFWKTSKAFWVNGKNCYDSAISNSHYDIMWGRLEIAHTGDKNTEFFNAMYVTDAGKDIDLKIESYENDFVQYAQVDKTIAVFTTTKESLQYEEFSFVTEGGGLYNYYLSGLETGTWNVTVDGVRVATVYSDDGEGFATFIAPAGKVTLVPGTDVVGANGGKIKYVTNGGVLEGEYPLAYKNDEETPLPTAITKPGCVFLGWYSTPTCDKGTELTEIPSGMTGIFTVYAKWLNNILDLNYNYESKAVNVNSGSQTVNGISYNTNSGTGVSFITKVDSTGTTYLEWVKGSKGSIMTESSSSNNYSTMMTDDECASFEVVVSKKADVPAVNSLFRIYTKKTPTTDDSSDTISRQVIFATNEEGEVNLGGASGPLVTVIGEEKVTIRIVLDFKNEELRAYNDYGKVIATLAVKPAAVSGTTTMSEWRKLLDSIIYYWIGQGTTSEGTLNIYSIKIDEGNRFNNLKPTDGMIVYDLGGKGILADAPVRYSTTTPTELPIPTPSGSAEFCGWYTTPDFQPDTEIAEIPTTQKGIAYVYAKWSSYIINEEFVGANIFATSGDAYLNGITYRTNNGFASSFISMKDESGKNYLEWCEGSGADNPFVFSNSSAIKNAEGDRITYELSFSKNGDAPLPSFYMRTYSKHNVNGDELSSSTSIVLFKVTDGGIYLSQSSEAVQEGDIKIADITEGINNVKVVLDFSDLSVSAYTSDGELVKYYFKISEDSGATTGKEYQSTFKRNLFYLMATSPASVVDASMRIYSIRISDGENTGESALLDGKLVYVANGAELPEDAPKEYSLDKATPLPVLTKDNSVFDGWYTSKSFSADTKLTEIPAGTRGLVTVYAKWVTVIKDEDYTDSNFIIEESKSDSNNGISYNTGSEKEPKPGAGFSTCTDENGNVYVKNTAGNKNTVMYVTSSSYNLTHFSDTAISYQISLKKIKDESLADMTFRLTTSSSAYGGFDYANLYGQTGEIKFVGSDTVIATVTEEFTTVRITIDFLTSAAYAYTEDGRVIDSISLSVPKPASGNQKPASMLEWQKVAQKYLFYLSANTSVSGEVSSVGIDNLKIVEGRAFVKVSEDNDSGTVVYFTNGGKLSDGITAPIPEGGIATLPTPVNDGYRLVGWYTHPSLDESYKVTSIEAGTDGIVKLYAKWEEWGIVYELNDGEFAEGDVPATDFTEGGATVIPTPVKARHKFLGWYTTPDFKEDTRLENNEIPEGATGLVRLYAKWEETGIHYNLNGGAFAEGDVPYIDFVEGDVTPLLTPVRDGYDFGGWYTDANFDEASLIVEIPKGASGLYTLYAKWERNGINYELNGGAFAEGDTPYTDFIEGEETPLIAPEKPGYIFGGWYTTPSFEDGTKCESIPAGTTGSYWVYAKWLFIVSEDFTDEPEDLVYNPQDTKTKELNNSNIYIGSPNCKDTVFKTLKDENNTPYLHISRGSKGPRVLDNNSGSLTKFNSGIVRFEFVFAKDKDADGNFLPFMDMACRTLTKKDVNGATLSSNNYIYMFKVTDDGAFLTKNATSTYPNANKFAEFDENGVIRVNFEIDFNNLTITGFNENGEDVVTSFEIPESSGAKSGIEYMKTFNSYFFFLEGISDTADSTARIYSITIKETYGTAEV